MLVLSTLLQVHESAGTPAAVLPVALWAEILQHVPQQQRLSQCALIWVYMQNQCSFVSYDHKISAEDCNLVLGPE
jgi:hypothetical protein